MSTIKLRSEGISLVLKTHQIVTGVMDVAAVGAAATTVAVAITITVIMTISSVTITMAVMMCCYNGLW